MRASASLLLLLSLSLGCSRAELPYNDNSRDPEAYATDVKRLVLQHLADAKASREPADSLRGMVMELEQHANRPVGNYGPIYQKMTPAAQELLRECESLTNRPQGALLKKFDELAEMAQELPGEVTVHTSND